MRSSYDITLQRHVVVGTCLRQRREAQGHGRQLSNCADGPQVAINYASSSGSTLRKGPVYSQTLGPARPPQRRANHELLFLNSCGAPEAQPFFQLDHAEGKDSDAHYIDPSFGSDRGSVE